MSNTDVWDALCRPEPRHLKKIQGGRLTGKTDINPQWRYLAMTRQFGPCGVGWKYTIDKLWTEPGDGGEVFAFARVSVYVKRPAADGMSPAYPEYWSAPVEGVGGSMLVTKEKSGLYNDDEAFKKATTDALGTALKMLGVAADIYLGNFDGSKYLTPGPDEALKEKLDAERQEQLRADAEKTGLNIFNVAAQRGSEDLRLAWEASSPAIRAACKGHLAGLKELAKVADVARRKEVAHVEE